MFVFQPRTRPDQTSKIRDEAIGASGHDPIATAERLRRFASRTTAINAIIFASVAMFTIFAYLEFPFPAMVARHDRAGHQTGTESLEAYLLSFLGVQLIFVFVPICALLFHRVSIFRADGRGFSFSRQPTEEAPQIDPFPFGFALLLQIVLGLVTLSGVIHLGINSALSHS
jgi:hypothetical protein